MRGIINRAVFIARNSPHPRQSFLRADRWLAGIKLFEIGSKGDSLADNLSVNNALAESVIGLFKTEVIQKKDPWRGIEDFEFAALKWKWRFNNRRLLEPIGYLPPAEFEKMYYFKQKAQAFAEILD